MCELWFPLIDKGRKEGVVKGDLSNEQIVEIIINIHSLLTLRDDYGWAKPRRFLKTVLLPAITNSVQVPVASEAWSRTSERNCCQWR